MSSSESKSRYIPLPLDKPIPTLEDLKEPNSTKRQSIASALIHDVQVVLSAAESSSVSEYDSLYVGLSGIAFMGYHLARMSGLSLHSPVLSPSSLTTVAHAFLARVLRENPTMINVDPAAIYSPNQMSFMESRIGVATLILSCGHSSSHNTISDNWQAAKDYLNYALEQATSKLDHVVGATSALDGDQGDGQCEVLYGRAGLLYALLYLRMSVHAHSKEQRNELEAELAALLSDTALTRLVGSIIERGKIGARVLSSEPGAVHDADPGELPPLMWRWYGRRFLGAAHGVAGILHILLLCPKSVIDKHMPIISDTISWLIDSQQDDGNWPIMYQMPNDNLVHWCHGAPGFLMLLSTASRVLLHQSQTPDNEALVRRLKSALLRGADVVYQRGFLRKGVGICHGVAGSVYALLAASDADSVNCEELFLKAAHLACLATSHEDLTASKEMGTPDNPWSLFEGLAGTCCVWAEILSRLNSPTFRRTSSGFPAFDDLLL